MRVGYARRLAFKGEFVLMMCLSLEDWCNNLFVEEHDIKYNVYICITYIFMYLHECFRRKVHWSLNYSFRSVCQKLTKTITRNDGDLASKVVKFSVSFVKATCSKMPGI